MKLLSDSTLELSVKTPGWAFVLDADKTLSPIDTGRAVGSILGLNDRIRSMFESFGYTKKAFAQHVEIWSEIDVDIYLHTVMEVACTVQLHSFWLKLLTIFKDRPAFVVTAGIPQIWRYVLDAANLKNVQVLGGLHTKLDTYFVTPDCKAQIVQDLQVAGCCVMAAGDSVIDLPMLKTADLPLWVPDKKGSPRLRPYLSELNHIRLFVLDERRFPPISPIMIEELISLLTKECP